MKKNILLFCCFLCVFTSCKTLVTPNNLKTTNQQLSLGSIGITTGNVLKKEFKATAFPSYTNPIKITARLYCVFHSFYSVLIRINE